MSNKFFHLSNGSLALDRMGGRYNRFNELFVLLLLVGYFFISFLPGIVGTASRVFTVPYRGLIIFLSIFIILKGVLYKGNENFASWSWKAFYVFWTIYLIRVIVDLYFIGVNATVFTATSDYLLNAVGICLVPAVAIRYAEQVDYQWVLKWVFRLLLIALVFSVAFNISDTAEGNEYAGRYRGSAGVNTISYGHYGVTFALISIYLFGRSSALLPKVFYIASFFFGLFIMSIAGSRSPLVALLLCLMFYQINNKGAVRGVFTLLALSIPLYIFSDQIVELLSSFGGSFMERIILTIEKGNTSGRDTIYEQSYHEFTYSPWIGSSFLVQHGPAKGFYPHNIVLEALMATGLFGGMIFLTWVAKCLQASYKLIVDADPNSWVGVLFLQYLILGMFSLAIFNNATFWYYSVIVLSVAYKAKAKEQEVKTIQYS